MSIIPNAVSSKFGQAALQFSKVSPRVMFVGGLVGVAATAVLASRATLGLGDILSEADEFLEHINKRTTHSDQDDRKDKAYVFIRASVKIAKLYAPSLAVAAVTVGLLTGSHNVLSKRNAALTAAYASIEKGFREYRGRVVDDQGADKDRQYLLGVEEREVEVVNKKGEKKVKVVKEATRTSPYGRLFNSHNHNWVPDNGMNLVFLKCQQDYVNNRLQANGWIVLNDVYDALGFDRSKEGQVVGWLRDGDGDNFIDFGIWERDNANRVLDYIAGREGEVLLDFNVDGVIHDKI